MLAFATALAAGSPAGCTDDPLADYDAMRRAAEIEGGVTAVARGEVADVRGPRLFEISNGELLEDRLWVLSLEERMLSIGESVLAEGTLDRLPVAEIERHHDIDIPEDVELVLHDEPLLVVESVATIVPNRWRE